MKRVMLLGAFFILLTGCISSSRDLNVPKSTHLYINSITSSSEIKVEAGMTQPIMENAKIGKDIELIAFHNNQKVEVTKTGSGLLVKLEKKLTSGDKMTLTATSSDLSSVSGRCEVLDSPMILSCEGKWIISKDDKSIV